MQILVHQEPGKKEVLANNLLFQNLVYKACLWKVGPTTRWVCVFKDPRPQAQSPKALSKKKRLQGWKDPNPGGLSCWYLSSFHSWYFVVHFISCSWFFKPWDTIACWYLWGESSFQGFLGGAGVRPSVGSSPRTHLELPNCLFPDRWL